MGNRPSCRSSVRRSVDTVLFLERPFFQENLNRVVLEKWSWSRSVGLPSVSDRKWTCVVNSVGPTTDGRKYSHAPCIVHFFGCRCRNLTPGPFIHGTFDNSISESDGDHTTHHQCRRVHTRTCASTSLTCRVARCKELRKQKTLMEQHMIVYIYAATRIPVR